jgi:hypothetical protein
MDCTIDEAASSEDDGLGELTHWDEEEHAEADADRVEDGCPEFAGDFCYEKI